MNDKKQPRGICNGKTRHLSPSDAQFCNQCGSAKLTDATASIPLGCFTRLVIWSGVLGAFFVLMPHLMGWSGWTFQRMTGFQSPLVWLIEKCPHILIILFIFYFLSMFMPGAAGQQFRTLISNLSSQSLRLGFQLLQQAIVLVGKILFAMIEGGESEKKNKH